MSQPGNVPKGPPYLPQAAQTGGVPTVSIDVPALGVLLAIYIGFAATNMTIFQVNNRRKHIFRPSVLLFGFCMARITTCILRIAWATRQTNARLAIAAGIFINAGILILYILNLFFAHRILKAKKPQHAWLKPLDILIKGLYVLIVGALIMVITATILSFYTLNMHTRKVARDIQLAAITYLLFIAALPLLLLAVAFLAPHDRYERDFGTESMHSKGFIILLTTTICVIVAGFKAGVAWETPRPINDPAWYHSKAAFYVFNFTLEILALSVFTFTRIDKRFYIPKATTKEGDEVAETNMSTEENERVSVSSEVKFATEL
ncbi:hypothetical protein LTR84_003492 [Exophiala bonariae]|uniref:G-protein coupled receptors family 3 profile domain-containing protein n=1 Tax=Exophiala bonariae TaxID=1690606 RepID=A0AAV9N790_9EURO|nr:hypothetical protein LTR84_003492 [Exophiala bonariae]